MGKSSSGSDVGTGGMLAKLEAARIAADSGADMVIANGEDVSVVQQIRAWQPEAVIFIMANLHVSRAKNNMETEFNNININDKNVACARIANGTDIFYLDSNPLFTDSEGFLQAEMTFDGVHLYAQHYDKWRQFLLEHGVERTNPGTSAPVVVNETGDVSGVPDTGTETVTEEGAR